MRIDKDQEFKKEVKGDKRKSRKRKRKWRKAKEREKWWKKRGGGVFTFPQSKIRSWIRVKGDIRLPNLRLWTMLKTREKNNGGRRYDNE